MSPTILTAGSYITQTSDGTRLFWMRSSVCGLPLRNSALALPDVHAISLKSCPTPASLTEDRQVLIFCFQERHAISVWNKCLTSIAPMISRLHTQESSGTVPLPRREDDAKIFDPVPADCDGSSGLRSSWSRFFGFSIRQVKYEIQKPRDIDFCLSVVLHRVPISYGGANSRRGSSARQRWS